MYFVALRLRPLLWCPVTTTRNAHGYVTAAKKTQTLANINLKTCAGVAVLKLKGRDSCL